MGQAGDTLSKEKNKLLLSTPTVNKGHGLSPLPARRLQIQGWTSRADCRGLGSPSLAHVCELSLLPDHTPQAPASWGAGPPVGTARGLLLRALFLGHLI